MRRSTLSVGIVLLAILPACGKKAAIEIDRGAENAAPAMVKEVVPVPTPSASSLNLGTAGIPSSCQEIVDPDLGREDLVSILEQLLSPSKTRKACFQCTPSRLVRIKCLEIDKGDLANVCGHRQEKGAPVIGCKSGEKIEKFSLAPSRFEKAVEMIPVLSALFGPALLDKLPAATHPIQRLVAEKSLSFAGIYLTSVVYGEQIPEAAATIAGIASDIQTKRGQVKLSVEAKSEIESTATAVLQGISKAAQRQDSLTPQLISSLMNPLTAKVPELAALIPAMTVLFADMEAKDLLSILMMALSQNDGLAMARMLGGLGGTGSVNP